MNYENAGFFAQYGLAYKKSAYYTTNAGVTSSKSGQAHRIEAGYDANNLFVAGGYQYTNGWDTLGSYQAALVGDSGHIKSDDENRIKTHELALTGAYRFGNVTPRLSYAHGFKAKGEHLSADQRKICEMPSSCIGCRLRLL